MTTPDIPDEVVEAINGTSDDLEGARILLSRGRIWTAYKMIKQARRRLYIAERGLAHLSPRAASDWGCGINLGNGKIGIIADI